MIPLRSAPFRWLWCSTLAAAGAQGLERTATAWLAYEVSGSALAVGPGLLIAFSGVATCYLAVAAVSALGAPVPPDWRARPTVPPPPPPWASWEQVHAATEDLRTHRFLLLRRPEHLNDEERTDLQR